MNVVVLKNMYLKIPEWIGDPDADNTRRLGLWQVCLKDDAVCQRRWEDILAVPSLPFQVCCCCYFYIGFQCYSFDYLLIGGDNICCNFCTDSRTHNFLINIDAFYEINDSFSYLWLDANLIRYIFIYINICNQ